jgi:hypothetical protein
MTEAEATVVAGTGRRRVPPPGGVSSMQVDPSTTARSVHQRVPVHHRAGLGDLVTSLPQRVLRILDDSWRLAAAGQGDRKSVFGAAANGGMPVVGYQQVRAVPAAHGGCAPTR